NDYFPAILPVLEQLTHRYSWRAISTSNGYQYFNRRCSLGVASEPRQSTQSQLLAGSQGDRVQPSGVFGDEFGQLLSHAGIPEGFDVIGRFLDGLLTRIGLEGNRDLVGHALDVLEVAHSLPVNENTRCRRANGWRASCLHAAPDEAPGRSAPRW